MKNLINNHFQVVPLRARIHRAVWNATDPADPLNIPTTSPLSVLINFFPLRRWVALTCIPRCTPIAPKSINEPTKFMFYFKKVSLCSCQELHFVILDYIHLSPWSMNCLLSEHEIKFHGLN